MLPTNPTRQTVASVRWLLHSPSSNTVLQALAADWLQLAAEQAALQAQVVALTADLDAARKALVDIDTKSKSVYAEEWSDATLREINAALQAALADLARCNDNLDFDQLATGVALQAAQATPPEGGEGTGR